MKKKIMFFLILSFSILFVSCTTEETHIVETNVYESINYKASETAASARFKVFEAGGFDDVLGANHSREIDLTISNYKKANIEQRKAINFNGIDYQLEYDTTKDGYEYNFDENGHHLFGKALLFNDFYRNYGKSHTEKTQELSEITINESLPMPLKNQPLHANKIVIYACVIIPLLAFGVITAFTVLRLRRRKLKTQ